MKKQLIGYLTLTLILTVSSYGGERDGPGNIQGRQDAVVHRTVNQRTISIRIHNYARVKPSVLNQATKVASDIFRDAGVDSVWVECAVGETFSTDSVCANPLSSLDLVVNLLPRSRTQNFRFRDEVLGMAMETNTQDFGAFYRSSTKVWSFAQHTGAWIWQIFWEMWWLTSLATCYWAHIPIPIVA
jgi:hypothetical protein